MAAIMAAIMEITENIMRRMREPSTKLHNALYFMSGMMVVILALVIVAGSSSRLSESEILILFIGLLLSFHAVCIGIRRRNRFFYEMSVLPEKCTGIISI